MNCCSKSGFHKHSPNSQIHIQTFHGIARLFSLDLPDHGEDSFHVVRCVRAIYGDGGPMSLPYSFDVPGQLKNWLLVQGVSPQAFMVWATGSPLLYQVSATRLSESSESSS